MKTNALMITCLTLASFASGATAQTLLLEYNFESSSGSTVNDGSGNGRNGTLVSPAAIGASGSGVSGLPGDYALNNTASTVGAAGGALNYASSAGLNSLTSFTMALWYKFDTVPTGTQAPRIWDSTGGGTTGTTSLFSGNRFLFQTFDGVNATNRFDLTNNSALYPGAGNWVFLAITFDASLESNQLKLYAGSDSTAATLIAQTTYAASSLTVASNGATLAFGNNQATNRALDGWLDDIHLYGSTSGSSSALSLAQIVNIQNSAIPEPATGVLVLGGFVLALTRRRAVR